MKSKWTLYQISVLIIAFCGCKSDKSLPYLGVDTVVDGKVSHHVVGNFSHYNQDSILINNDSLRNNIYIVDFFFTSCPSICPKVAKEMLKIYEAFAAEPIVKLVSFTIDPKRDDVNKLKLYGDNLGIDPKKWYLLTGEKDATLKLAATYFVSALEDKDAPGGFDHSGKILLVDKNGHVRAFTDGTDPKSTPQFIENVRLLLKSEP